MAYCDEYIELISAAIDGALSPAEQKKLEAHLSSCPECKALYEDLTSLHTSLMDLSPVEVPAGLTERIMAAVAAEQVLPFEKKRSPRPWQRWLASAAVLAVVLMGTWAWKPWNTTAKNSAPQAAMGERSMESTLTGIGAAGDAAAPEAVSADADQVSPAVVFDSGATVMTEAAEDDPAPTLVPEVPMINGGAIAGKGKKDKDFSVSSADAVPAEAPEYSDGMAPRMSRIMPATENGEGDGGGSAMPTDVPAAIEAEEAAPEPKSLMMITTGLPTEDANTKKILTAQEALELLADYLWPGIAVEKSYSDSESPSCTVTSPDGSAVSLTVDGVDANGDYHVFLHSDETDEIYLYLVNRVSGTVLPLFAPENETP